MEQRIIGQLPLAIPITSPGDADQCNSEDNRNLFVGLNYTGSAYTNNWTTNTFVVGADGYDLEMRDAYRLNANEYYFVAKATSCSGTSSICVGKVDNSPSVSGQIVSFNSENLIPYCVASHNGYVYVGGWKNGLNAKAFIVKLDPTNNYNPVAYVELYDDNNGAVWDIRPIDGKICAVGHIKKPGSSEYQKGHITTLDNDLNVLHNLIIQEDAGFNMQIKGLDKYCQNEIVVAGNYRTSSSSDRSPWMSRFTISEEGVVSPAFESCGQVPVYAYPHTGDDYALNVVYDANNEKVMMVNESISGSAISAHVIQADGELLSGCETQLSVNFEVYNEDVEAYTTTFSVPTLPALSNYTGLDVDDAHLGTVSSDCTQGSMPNQETMGIENSKEMDHTIEVFPNPATNMLSVQSNESGTARIIGLDGREVLSGIQMISGKTEVNISALHPGEYILQFVGTSSVTTTKFIKR